MMNIRYIKNKVLELGILSIVVGSLKHSYYRRLMQRYKFDNWHTSPIELRKYARDIVDYVSDHLTQNDVVVEVGCGLGEIIRKISRINKSIVLYGFDISNEVIKAARIIDKSKNIKYFVGSFGDVKNEKIEYLITVNFIHEIDPETLASYYNSIISNNHISHIIVDTVSHERYLYHHDFSKILPREYKLIHKSNLYSDVRFFLVYKKT